MACGHRRPRRFASGQLRPLATATASALLACLVGLGGCASGPGVAVEQPLEGIDIAWLRIAPANGRAEWFVRPTGEIEYRGGVDSVLKRPTWTGALAADDVARLQAILDDARAYPSGLEDGPETGVETELMLRHPSVDGGRRRTLEAAGDPPNASPLLQFLRDVSSPRLRAVLDRLPKAGATR
ncbi:MAG: hypothetical protein AB8G96_06020 [Phycisphaerales bacterium]